jgi:hypothetical protein
MTRNGGENVSKNFGLKTLKRFSQSGVEAVVSDIRFLGSDRGQNIG